MKVPGSPGCFQDNLAKDRQRGAAAEERIEKIAARFLQSMLILIDSQEQTRPRDILLNGHVG